MWRRFRLDHLHREINLQRFNIEDTAVILIDHQVGTNTFTVSATNANTTGNSATFTVVVLPNGTDFVPPTPVAQMTASAISYDRCPLSWTPAGDNIGVANYRLVASHFGASGNHVVTLDVPGTTTNTTLRLPNGRRSISLAIRDGASSGCAIA